MRISIVIFLLVLANLAFAGGNDSLVKFNELSFHSDFERELFKSYISKKSQTDIIDLFLHTFEKKNSINSTAIHAKINDCVAVLLKETKGLSETKKVKEIYKFIHKRFLSVYKLRNSFADIFDKGEYNCVSASALYAIVFKMMDIPFQIIEAPQHVYLVAYPNSHKIMIETTLPTNGYFTFSDVYIEKFIKYMYENKIISKEEYDFHSANELFNKYYFMNKGMSLLELAGIQYSNFTAYHIDDENYAEAQKEIKKAYFLIPSERNKYLLQNITIHLVRNKKYKTSEDVNDLCILCRYNNVSKNDISDENIKYEFGRITEEQFITNSNTFEFENSFKLLQNCITDSILKNEIAFYYHYELSRMGIQKLKDKQYLFEHFKKAYNIKPKHNDIQSIIRSYFFILVDKNGEPNYVAKIIQEFIENFNFLNTDPAFNSIRANCLLEMCYQHFTYKDYIKGETFRLDFEKLADSDKEIIPSERFVEKAYSTVASYYFKKGNKLKTKEVLKKGLQYSPDNFGLKIRLNQLN